MFQRRYTVTTPRQTTRVAYAPRAATRRQWQRTTKLDIYDTREHWQHDAAFRG